MENNGLVPSYARSWILIHCGAHLHAGKWLLQRCMNEPAFRASLHM